MGFAVSYVEFDEYFVEYCVKEREHVTTDIYACDRWHKKKPAWTYPSCNNIVKEDGEKEPSPIGFNVVLNTQFFKKKKKKKDENDTRKQ